MSFKLIFIMLNLFSMLAIAEEVNLFQTNYLSQSNNNLYSLQKKPDTKIYAGMNKEKDNNRMLEDGYDLMGVSSFQGAFVEPNEALKHAQSIQADVVLVYDRQMNEMTRATLLRKAREDIKKDSGGKKNTVVEVSEADLKDKNSKFEFYATYWAKLPQPILGLHVIKLSTKNSDTKETQQEKGLKVIAVIKDSPAFKVGFQKGDVILELNDVNAESPEVFSKSIFNLQGNKVKIKYVRDDEEKVVSADLNRR